MAAAFPAAEDSPPYALEAAERTDSHFISGMDRSSLALRINHSVVVDRLVAAAHRATLKTDRTGSGDGEVPCSGACGLCPQETISICICIRTMSDVILFA